uniref:Uncharacterized protein n=1 Tax=Oryza glaberrima TaxID=4538 RepID=I1QSY9_ORYGL
MAAAAAQLWGATWAPSLRWKRRGSSVAAAGSAGGAKRRRHRWKRLGGGGAHGGAVVAAPTGGRGGGSAWLGRAKWAGSAGPAAREEGGREGKEKGNGPNEWEFGPN